MLKIGALLVSTIILAASCNLTDPFGVTSGSRGVFKSEDGGESFMPYNVLDRSRNINNVSVNTLVFDPNSSEVIYLGSGSGVYKSENGAKSWSYILTGIGVADLALDLRQAQTIYAVGLSGNNGKVLKSKDGGKNWADLYTEPSKANSVLSVTASSNTIIVGLANGEIIRSTDFGNTWQSSRDLQDRIVKIRFGPNSSTVFALGRTTGLYKSTDSGLSWTNLTSVLTDDSFFSPGSSLSNVSLFHDFALDSRQPGVIYLATEQGLFRSVNDGANWNNLTLPVSNTALKVSSVTVNPTNSNNIFVGIGSTLLKSLNGAITWETKELRTQQAIRVILVDPKSPNIVYLGLGERK